MSENLLKEKNIISAARKRFAHYGFSKVTMDEIAGDVEMGKASLYYYFPTKEDLFKAVVVEEQNEFTKKIETILQKQTSFSEKLNEYVEQRLKYFHDLVNLGMLSVHSLFDIKSMFKKLFEDFEAQELILLKRIIEDGKNAGEFRKDLPEDLTKIFLHMLQGLRLRVIKILTEHRSEDDTYKELEREMKIAAEIFIKGIIQE
ncbi:MAG: TetR/AcrR family transcriptional regulator [Bacteroidetes bacterium]|nr:TetR/AcrR family transcriptional regulator [Bacteroidota bacterium]